MNMLYRYFISSLARIKQSCLRFHLIRLYRLYGKLHKCQRTTSRIEDPCRDASEQLRISDMTVYATMFDKVECIHLIGFNSARGCLHGNPACWPTTASSYHSYQLVQHATTFCFRPFHAIQSGDGRLKNMILLFQHFRCLYVTYNIVSEYFFSNNPT